MFKIAGQKRLIVISSGSFPYGGAATNRHLSYLKPFAKMGVETNVYLLNKSKHQSLLSNSDEGVYENINFKYTLLKKSNNVYLKSYNYLKSTINARKIVLRDLKFSNLNKSTVILVLSTDPFVLFMFIKLAKKYKVKIFHERTEYPFINQTSIFKRYRLLFYYPLLKKLNGLFVITEALVKFFQQYMDPEKIIRVPMTVEPERFQINRSESEYGEYIAYCGSMYGDKDGVPILLKAFDLFAEKNKNVNLVLIGDTRNKERFGLIESIYFKMANKERVFFTGKVERDQMPRLLVNATVLALARPDNIQAKGGFPTKLGEYLATGNPVVVTSVGEIPNYLKHLDNAYIAKPDSMEDFAKVLELPFLDPYNARRIGMKGKELVHEVFNNVVQAEHLFQFFYNKGAS